MRRPQRPRFPQFPRGGRAGAGMVVAMSVALFCAAGLPGLAAGDAPSPGENWMYLHEEARVQLDSVVTVPGADANEDRALVESVLADKRVGAAGRVPRKRAPLRTIDFRAMAHRAAVGAGIKRPGLFVRQMAAESGMQPCAVSGAGAIGIAQIMPATARSWGVDPWLPADALRAAATNMARYERQLGSYELALAAYNAGPGAVQRFGGVPPYEETRNYITKIMRVSTPIAGLRQEFDIPQRMTPGFAGRLRALLRDVKRNGGTFTVEEAWRSYEDSTRIWRAAKKQRGGWDAAKKWAAPPGCSNHVRGLAADLLGSKRNLALAARLAPKHGLVFPMAHEPWHVELAGIKTQSR